MRKTILTLIILLFPIISLTQETIDVTVQGISDGYKNSKQQDRDEAILDAKLKAIERAGVSIEAVTVMDNFKLKKDWVESKAQAVILPGFQIIDMGYGVDGLYHVVLSGKVSRGTESALGDSEGDKKFRMAKLYLQDDKAKALTMMKEVVDNYGDCSAADDALYYLIVESTYNIDSAKERLIKLKAYYPDSPYIATAESYIARKEEQKRQEEIRRAEERKRIINKIKFVQIHAGSFMMGSNSGYSDEKPVHRVTLKPFMMQTTEVTQSQWKAVMENNPSHFKGDNLPVECVSWNDCQEFIKKLNEMDPGKGYRLPSEAEWEYACRAGTTTKYYSGNSEYDLGRAGWYKGNSGSTTHAVGQKTANNWGLYDMHGNVWEWCEDWYHSSYGGSPTDGSAWLSPSSSYRVLRGGSWYDGPNYCRSADRDWDVPDDRVSRYGFRLARSL